MVSVLASEHGTGGVPPLTRDEASALTPPGAFGSFRVMHQIGVGVLGPVFRTYEPVQDRHVAVKVFQLDVTPEQAAALVDALRQLVSISPSHRSIASPISAGLEDGAPYLAQEYVAAESLDIAMRHYTPAASETALPVIAQLAEAIDAAHERGIVHGALHLRDVFVTPANARTTGFGVIRALETIGFRGPIRRPYTAPEQIAGRPWGPEADRFALAAIAYELLTGKRAAGTGDQVTERLDAVPDVDDQGAFRTTFVTGLADAPEKRYSSAGEFVACLSQALGLEPAPSRQAFAIPDLLAELDHKPRGSHAEPIDLETAAADISEHGPATGSTLFDSASSAESELTALDRTLEQIDALKVSSLEDAENLTEPGLPFDGHAGDADDFCSASGVESAAEFESEPVRLPYDSTQTSSWSVRGMMTIAFAVVLASLAAYVIGMALGSRDGETTVAQEPITPTAHDKILQEPVSSPDVTQKRIEETLVAPEENVATQPDAPVSAQLGPRGATVLAPAGSIPSTANPAHASSPGVSVEGRKENTPERTRTLRAGISPENFVGTGWLLIRTDPPGADVVVDGIPRGQTPLSLRDVTFGAHRLMVSSPGYDTQDRAVTLTKEAAVAAVSMDLLTASSPPERMADQLERGSVFVDSRPPGASVLVDNRSVGITPVLATDIPPGSHRIRIEHNGYQTWATTIDLPDAGHMRVAASLERSPQR